MSQAFCGLDFGTSNSTVAASRDGTVALCPLEGDKVTLPSAIFFDFDAHLTRFGRDALEHYIEGTSGRLLRALKSVLGSSLIDGTTRLQSRPVPLRAIIGRLLAHLKQRAEAHVGREVASVVLGRPVRFVDDDDAADRRAEDELVGIARAQGFVHVETQYEPVAAALAYERGLTAEELAIVIDIGGGTSDFALVRLSPQRARAADRTADILARAGVHVGGTDFDRTLSLDRVMPALGYHTEIGPKRLPVPRAFFQDLATWHKIPFVYTRQNVAYLRSIRPDAHEPELIDRLTEVIEHRHGHEIAAEVEAAKIALSAGQGARVAPALKHAFSVAIRQEDLDRAVGPAVAAMAAAIARCCAEAGVAPSDIDSAFLTGGSIAIPAVRDGLLAVLPGVEVVEGDLFGSVGLGLGLDAERRFG